VDVDAEIAGIISRFNESVGGVNDDKGGYHDTITRAYVAGVRLFLRAHSRRRLADRVNALLLADGPARLAARLLQPRAAVLGGGAPRFRAPDRAPLPSTVLDHRRHAITPRRYAMSIFDGILGQVTQNADIKNLAAKVGLSPEHVESAVQALAKAHPMPGDTAEGAAAATGLPLDKIQEIVGHIGGEGALANFASLVKAGSCLPRGDVRSTTWPSTVIGTLPPSTTASLNALKS
jgi:hypothetical protein